MTKQLRKELLNLEHCYCNSKCAYDKSKECEDYLNNAPKMLCPQMITKIHALYKEAGWVQPPESKDCEYCHRKPDGAMLRMGGRVAHSDCVIQKLNELLDPDWEIGDTRKPDRVVGCLTGYVELAKDQSLPDTEDYCQLIQGHNDYLGRMSGYRQAQQDMVKAGFRKVIIEEVKDGC